MKKKSTGKAGKTKASTEESNVSVGVFERTRFHLPRGEKVWLILGVLIAILLLVLGGTSLYQDLTKPSDMEIRAESRLKQYKNEPVPVANDEKASYYGNLADAYFESGKYSEALQDYLKADKYLGSTEARTATSQTMNISIATTYAKLGDKEKARLYYERQITLLKGSGNDDLIKKIQQYEAEL